MSVLTTVQLNYELLNYHSRGEGLTLSKRGLEIHGITSRKVTKWWPVKLTLSQKSLELGRGVSEIN